MPEGLSVLVVDDCADTVLSLAMLLRASGHRVRAALSGEKALELAAEEVPDAVLLDLTMPRMDGLELAARLRGVASAKRPFLVAVSGRGSALDRERCRQAGIDMFFLKPADPTELVTVLERLCRVVTPACSA